MKITQSMIRKATINIFREFKSSKTPLHLSSGQRKHLKERRNPSGSILSSPTDGPSV